MPSGIEFVTGGLGDGKSLYCVSRIVQALAEGRKVATNYNLDLAAVCRPTNNWVRVVRVPDAPSVDDLRVIGLGSDDPKKPGLLVLDELGTWFNARDYANKDRAKVLRYCIHLRKKRWHVLFIVQDFTMVDKQLRGGMTTFLTTCRSSHKGWWFLRVFPEFFYAVVRNKERIHVSTHCVFPGEQKTLFRAYDTEQLFNVQADDDEEDADDVPLADAELVERERQYRELNGLYSLLPPAYTLPAGAKDERVRAGFTLTMVVWPLLLIAGVMYLKSYFFPADDVQVEESGGQAMVSELAIEAETASDPLGVRLPSELPSVDTFEQQYGALTITGYTRFGDAVRYTFMDQRSGAVRHQAEIEAAGVVVKPRSRDEALLVGPDYRFVAVTR